MGQSSSSKRPASAPANIVTQRVDATTTMSPKQEAVTPGGSPSTPAVIIHKSSISTVTVTQRSLNDETESRSISGGTLPRLNRQMTKSMGSLSKLFHKGGKFRRKRRGSISASFNMNDRDIQIELMNVNTATEEELMTLPGVNRTLAKNIINHRILIGGFRKVEDVALVSGMGATKLDAIRPEVCVSKRRQPAVSRTSSKSGSVESLPDSLSSRMTSTTAITNNNNTWYNRPIKCLNINKASIFDLMTIPGVNQALAARIVSYRDRKGPYKNLDDLKNIRISYNRLGAIRAYLTTEEVAGNEPQKVKCHSRASSYPAIIRTNSSRTFVGSGSTSLKGTPLPDMTPIFELMSIQSPRPFYAKSFHQTHNDQPAYRIATWNMEALTYDKITNLGVLEVITRTILENGFSVVAMQEICDKVALKKICDELNEPKLARIREWKLPRGIWKFVLHDTAMHYDKVAYHLGILYNSEQVPEITLPKDSATFTPFQNGSLTQYAIFKVKTRDNSLILVNTLSKTLDSHSHHQPVNYSNGHATTKDSNVEAINKLIKAQVDTTGTQGAIILGHFSAKSLETGLSSLDDMQRVVPEESSCDNVDCGSTNVWLTKGLYDYATGEAGFVSEGLTHLAIPNGWNWGGSVTNASPFWCTLYQSPCPKVSADAEVKPGPEATYLEEGTKGTGDQQQDQSQVNAS